MDEVVLVPKASSARTKPFKYATDILLPHEDENLCPRLHPLFHRRVATVQKVSKDRVYFRFDLGDDLTIAQIALLYKTRYDIIFRPRRYPLRYQHYALSLLANSYEIRKYLFPTENAYKHARFHHQFE